LLFICSQFFWFIGVVTFTVLDYIYIYVYIYIYIRKIFRVFNLVYETNRLEMKRVNIRFTLLQTAIPAVKLKASYALSQGDFSLNIARSATCFLG
jgi:hypothetical protein